MNERSSIVAAGPLTLEEAEAVLSSRPPPGPAIDEEPDAPAPQSQAAPHPDYSSDLPPEVEACSCEEALGLHTKVESLTEALAAAERGERDAVDALDANWVQHQRVVVAETRVRELEAELTLHHSAHSETVATAAAEIERLRAAKAAGPAPLRGWVEFPQYTRQRIPIFMVRDQLARHGLQVVSAADKDKAEAEQCVLDIVRDMMRVGPVWMREHLPTLREAADELARRGRKP